MLLSMHIAAEKRLSDLRDFLKRFSIPRWMVFSGDVASVFITFLFAYMLRYNLMMSGFSMLLALKQSVIVMAVYVFFMLLLKPYSGIIRFTTVKDISTVFLTSILSLTILSLITFFERIYGWNAVFNIPLSIVLIHFVCISALMLLERISIKLFYEVISRPRLRRKRVLIFGAGSLGIIVNKVVQNDTQSGLEIAGFLDDSRKRQNKTLDGVRIYSPKSLNASFVTKNNISSLILAVRDIPPLRKKEVIKAAMEAGLEVLDTPAPENWINGQLQLRQLKPVRIEDLLGRETIRLDLDMIARGLMGKTILVTGAAGSIGSEMVRQLARFPVKSLILTDQAETPLFQLETELRDKYPGLPCQLRIADVSRMEKMD